MNATRVGVIVKGTFETAPGGRQLLFEAVGAHMAETRKRVPGCAYYHLAADVENDCLIHLIEGWQDMEALESHLKSPELLAARERMSRIEMRNYSTFIFKVAEQTNYLRDDV